MTYYQSRRDIVIPGIAELNLRRLQKRDKNIFVDFILVRIYKFGYFKIYRLKSDQIGSNYLTVTTLAFAKRRAHFGCAWVIQMTLGYLPGFHGKIYSIIGTRNKSKYQKK